MGQVPVGGVPEATILSHIDVSLPLFPLECPGQPSQQRIIQPDMSYAEAKKPQYKASDATKPRPGSGGGPTARVGSCQLKISV